MLFETPSAAHFSEDFDQVGFVMNNQQQQDLLGFFQQQQHQQDQGSTRSNNNNNGIFNFACSVDYSPKMSARQFSSNANANSTSNSNRSASFNFLEPTPISHFGINVVDQVPLANSALNVVSGQQQQELTDWIQVLRNNGLPAAAAAAATQHSGSVGSMPMGSSMQAPAAMPFAPQQRSGLNPSFAPLYGPSIDLQQCPRDDTLDYRRAESARLMQQSNNSTTSQQELQIRPHQSEKWQERYLELVGFYKRFGHSVVPYHYKESSALAWWVKRQRHQYKMKREGLHSTLTDEREKLLEQLEFVWDSHSAIWEMRLQELNDYKEKHGHTSISQSENPKLLVWVKCQRRQFKLYAAGQKSSMTPERINKLDAIGFCWNPRRGAGAASAR